MIVLPLDGGLALRLTPQQNAFQEIVATSVSVTQSTSMVSISTSVTTIEGIALA
jgi:hypothetical protein